MKFELQPDNRNCEDQTLLDDLVSVARALGKATITKEDYQKNGRFSPATIQNRFGAWNFALERSGLTVGKRNNIPAEEIIADIKRVSEIVAQESLSRSEYQLHGRFSSANIAKRFGDWEKALIKAGLNTSPLYHKKVNEDDLLNNIAVIWEKLGRQPKKSDLNPPLSKYSSDTYRRRFGSWRSALERFVEIANQDEEPFLTRIAVGTPAESEIFNEPEEKRRKTSRNPSWRLVFLVYRKNNFKCVACGRSPATDPTTILHVDHVVPWCKGGETVLENLQTLCSHCNLGKSDLPMTE
ncbi:homing endonuclease associated repeat-containing protein [Brachymonas sp. M4Q-1]|uniref:homing endonuclease associated repeat-containing protein n=1 Tax=Brachymonas sp. M4Q-1 TaxID=3416906 RepID=UPI003CFA1117